MAFQNVIDALSSTIHRDTISNPMVEQINAPLRESLEIFKYQLPPKALKYLNECGIDVTQFGPLTHPHPLHKSIELHLILKIWPCLAVGSCDVMFMKESKFEKIQKKNQSFKKVWNYKFSGKDSSRYKELSTTVPNSRVLFIHDAIMYFSREQMLGLFECCSSLERVFASLVVPPECEICDFSLYPSFYKFYRDKDKLVYQPENHAAGSYRQPFSALDWLKTTKIQGPEFTLRICILESWGPVHHLLIEKSEAPGDEDYDSVSFRVPDSILLPNPREIDQGIRNRLVPAKVYNACFSYVRSVRTLRETDPAGYIRTQMGKEEYDWVTPSAWDNLQSFILKTAGARPRLHYALFESPVARLLNKLSIHSERWGWVLAASASIAAFMLSRFAFDLARSEILSFSLLWSWIKSPKKEWYQLFSKKPKALSLKKEPKRLDLFGRKDLRPLVDEYPFIFQRFLPKEMNKWSMPVSVTLAAIPLLAQSWRRFTQKHAPQQLDQIYQAFFHPTPWTLKLTRGPVRLSSKPFFPDQKKMQSDAGKKPIDDSFMPHPDVIAKATEKFSFDAASKENDEHDEKESSESKEEESDVEEEEAEDDASSSSSSSSDSDDDDEDASAKPAEEKDEENVEPMEEDEPAADKAPFGVPDLLSDSDSEEKPAEPKSPISGGGPGGIWLKHVQNASCGVQKFVMGGYKLSLSDYHPQSLRGRECIFFAKHDMTYGHDKVLYHNFGWPLEVASIARFLSHEFKTDFNSVLINVYNDGASLPWHADDEICYDDQSPILTLNLQGEAFFNTRHEKFKVCNREILIKDDLLLMPAGFQGSHKHSVDGCKNHRISATFRHQKFSIPIKKADEKVKVEKGESSAQGSTKKQRKSESSESYEKEKSQKDQPSSAKKRKSSDSSKKRKVKDDDDLLREARPSKVRPYEPEVAEEKPSKGKTKRTVTSRRKVQFKDEEKASTDVSGVIPEQPENEEEAPPLRNDLLSDASAIGPVVRFCDQLKAAYVPNVALFLTRERNGAAPAPKIPKQACLLEAFSKRSGASVQELWSSLCRVLPNCLLENAEIRAKGLNSEHLTVLGALYQKKILLHTESGVFEYGIQGDKVDVIHINHSAEKGNQPGHFFVGGRVLKKNPVSGKSKCGDLIHAVLSFRLDDNLLPIKKVHDYETSVPRAKNLIANMKNGFDGIMANVEPLYPSKAREKFLSLDLIMDAAVTKKVKLIHIAGFPGCGKSYPIQNLLCLPMFKSHKVAVPTVELRGEWKEAMGYSESEKWRVSTWESSMLKSARVLVVDEVYKMPRGYVDLAIHADSSVQLVILLGDPIQGEYHSTHPSSNNKILEPESEHLRPFMDYYCLWSRRIPQNVAKFFNVSSTNKFGGIKKFQRAFPSNVPILCNAVVTAKTLADTGHYSTTIASSQGSTYDSVACINLDRSSSMLSKQLSLVALTRSKKGVVFCGDQRKLTKDASCNPLFADFWHDQVQDVTEVFQKTFSDMTVIREPIKKRAEVFSGKGSNKTLKRREQRNKIRMKDSLAIKRAPKNESIDPNNRMDIILDLSKPVSGDGSLNAPQISTHFLPETRRPLHYDFASAVPSDAKAMNVHFSQAAAECVYPGEDFNTLAALLVPAHDPEMKEIVFKDLRSNQFPLLDVKFELGALPSSLVAAKHSAKDDPTLLPASIEKRLRFRQSEASYELTAKDQLLGTLLFDSLCRAYDRNPNHSELFDENLFAECININEYAQLSNKTQAFIMANASRSDPDWRYTVVRIFSKTQHKINEATVFGNWKACQTLALMHDAVILILGPVKKYQRIFDKRDRPSSLYVHAGHTPYEMSEWCKQNLSKSEHVSNDYTAFDQSQHGEAVVLEVKKMERLNIPRNLIDFHIWLKTNVQTQFGPLTCMRLTGEPGTYDDNTDYNIAVLHSEYLIGKIPCMVSGDDSMLDKEPPPNPIWKFVEPLLNLRFKKFKSFYALFCGYYVGKEGACRSPLTLFAKLCTAVDDKSIGDKRLSYLTEFAVGHSLGQEMWMLFEEDQVMYQCANFDFFCRNCPREEKILLKLGEPDEKFINKLFYAACYISNPVFALLKRSVRKMYLGKRSESSPLSDPDSERMLKTLAEL